MMRIANGIGLIYLIAAQGALSAGTDLTQPTTDQPDIISNNAAFNLTLPESFDFTVNNHPYIVNNFQAPYKPIFTFYKFLIGCMNNALDGLGNILEHQDRAIGVEWATEIPDLGLAFTVQHDYWVSKEWEDIYFEDVGDFLQEFAWKLMPRFEDHGWVPLFSARIEERVNGAMVRGFKVQIWELVDGRRTTGKGGGGGGIYVA